MLRRVALVGTDVSEERIASSVLLLLVTANVPSSPILVILSVKAMIRSSESSVLTRTTRRHIPQDSILHTGRQITSSSLACVGSLEAGDHRRAWADH
jgi:hypothetical protein